MNPIYKAKFDLILMQGLAEKELSLYYAEEVWRHVKNGDKIKVTTG